MSLASFFCSSVPRMWSSLAKEKLDAIMPTAGLAPRISSSTAQRSDGGHDRPAQLGGDVDGPEPRLDVGRVRLLERLGQRHGVRRRVVDRRVAVGVEQAVGQLVLGEPGDLVQHLPGGVGVDGLVRARARARRRARRPRTARTRGRGRCCGSGSWGGLLRELLVGNPMMLLTGNPAQAMLRNAHPTDMLVQRPPSRLPVPTATLPRCAPAAAACCSSLPWSWWSSCSGTRGTRTSG